MSNKSYRSRGVGEVINFTVTTSMMFRRERWRLAKAASAERQITIATIDRSAIRGDSA
jgi:hypothetical protein